MKRSIRARSLALLLALVMVFSMLSVSAFAEEQGAAGEPAAAGEPPAAEAPQGESSADDPGLDAGDMQAPEPTAEPAEPEPESGAAVMDAGEPVTDYAVFLAALTQLEQYADAYVREHAGEESVALVINFIRTGVEKYNSGTWNTFCGEEKVGFTDFVAEQDAANGTNASCLKDLGTFTLPNGNEAEFAHMFGCMDMAYHTGNQDTADLGSWAGDLCDLLQLSQNYGVSGTVDEMADQIRTDNEHLFLYDDPNAHSFGRLDLYGDLDAFYLLSRLGGGTTLSQIMRSYYTASLNDSFRAAYFLENRLGGASTKAAIRSAVYEIYTSNEGITTLEGTYLENGVNPDIRKAVCYAFADYLYETAQNRLENPYFTVFSSETVMMAPGVTHETRMATTADDKQIVYHIAKADVSRSDVSVYANYADNTVSDWAMARVTDQMAAAQARHSDPNDPEHYIPNYNAVVGTNADFYNMSNGRPSGALVMEGVEYTGVGSQNFFAILKDGTPVMGGKTEWNALQGQIQEAVGTNIWLVRDGKIAVTANTNYYNDRAPRTAIGITYDGQVVLMVLDGRQEPYSAGGSSIEIAQIMLDAGCVVAANLDGGGSTTFAGRREGSDQITVLNRPSDGYERSVSSSVLVVSTAKPSNVFDHAIVSADYDYVTVGTSLDVELSGVTATGGVIDLPEGTALRVSDESIGTLSGNVFTAAALGDVQLQAVSAEGEVLGSKTIHVVEPTEIYFTRESVNAVYGVPEELPLEATYNGKLVKINPNDLQFGFLKVSLQSIGNVEGGDVNTTKTELVFEYPEAGTIDGFAFTGNETGGLRTLTLGAIQKSKLAEFQALINQAFMAAYQQALADGYESAQAQLIAQEAAVNKGLENAARIKVYLYSADEATFDFSQETGNQGLLHWRRDVSNSRYQREINMYYQQDPNEPMVTTYTFAVDMSKMPIPEKLTGLLYMLPGGDQEGRTAWDFLLQLAERISPLTTVTVRIEIPDGFDVDYSDLKLVNEYFDLTGVSLEGNTLTIIGNFKLQTEPINPTTANPLCVLSGLKLTPTDAAAWDAEEPDQLNVHLTGSLNYDIYAHFHILKSLASQEKYQVDYGLFPYDNSANIPLDYGAHFSSDSDKPIEFEDQYRLNRECRDGWVYEQGAWSYYDSGTKLTGAQQLPSYEDGEEGTFWYDLGENGACSGKLTGIFASGGAHYYARMGVQQTGWQSIVAADGESYFYYFDKTTGEMYTGVRTVDGLTYTFNDAGQLIRGAFRTTAQGTKYYIAGESQFRRFVTLEEGTYWLDVNGYVAYGPAHTVTTNVKDITWYHFDEETGLMDGLMSGLFQYQGKPYYCDENGKVFYGAVGVDGGVVYSATRGELYTNRSCYIDATTAQKDCALEPGKYWCGADGFIVANGFVDIDGGTYYFTDYVHAKGLTKIGDDYYLFNAGSGKMYKDATMWVGANDYGIEGGMYYFDADGKMFIPDLEHGVKKIVSENGKLYMTVDGVKLTSGLQELDGEYYYAQTNGELVTGRTIWVSQKNGLIPEKGDWHYFDAEGKMLQTGFVTGGDGYTYYYDENVLALGFTKIGDDYYLFNAGSGKMYRDATMWVGPNDYGIEGGMYYFDAEGKMFIPDLEHGVKKIVSENGKLYMTVDGVKLTSGLQELDGEYYYAQTNGELVTGRTIWVSQKNGLIPEKGDWHYFDAEGKMLQTGFVTGGDGYTYYYDENVLALGFTKIGEDYYLFNAGSGKMQKDKTLWVGANDYGFAGGMYYFGPDGKMFVPDLEHGVKKIVSENGKLYMTVDGVRLTNGLNELDGEYYYAQPNGELVTGKAVWVSQKNDLIPAKGDWHYFDAEGKMLQTGFVEGGDGYTYYYTDNVLALGLTKIGEDYYFFNAGSGKLQKDKTLWVGANDYGIVGGMYYFDADGKMVQN